MPSESAPLRPLALYQETLLHDNVRCILCPHHCVLRPGDRSRCHTRQNMEGQLVVLNAGRVTALSLDPIEKKPLRAFHPGTRILSAGSFGCNLSCTFCQNWQIAHREAPSEFIPPEKLLQLAINAIPDGNIGMAFTYNEPTVWYETVLETSRLLKNEGLKTVLVTNGFIEPDPLEALLPFIDAMNIDLKAMTNHFYQKLCGGSLEPVKRTISRSHAACHIELTTLVIPGWNDSDEEILLLSEWIASLSPDIPLHLSRHHPAFKMEEPSPISVKRLLHLAALAGKALHHVYMGNVG